MVETCGAKNQKGAHVQIAGEDHDYHIFHSKGTILKHWVSK